MNLLSDLSAQQEVKLAGPLSRRTAGQRARGPVAEAHVPRRRLLAPSTWRESRAPRGAGLALGALSRPLPSHYPGRPLGTHSPAHGPLPRVPAALRKALTRGSVSHFSGCQRPLPPDSLTAERGLQAAGVRLSWFSPRGGLAPTSRAPTSAPQALAHRREELRASGSDRRKRVCPAGPRAGTARFVPASGAGPGRRDGDTSPVTASAIGKDSRNRLGQVPCSRLSDQHLLRKNSLALQAGTVIRNACFLYSGNNEPNPSSGGLGGM